MKFRISFAYLQKSCWHLYWFIMAENCIGKWYGICYSFFSWFSTLSKIIVNEINNYSKLISWKRRNYENVWFGNFPGSSPVDGPADHAQWWAVLSPAEVCPGPIPQSLSSSWTTDNVCLIYSNTRKVEGLNNRKCVFNLINHKKYFGAQQQIMCCSVPVGLIFYRERAL